MNFTKVNGYFSRASPLLVPLLHLFVFWILYEVLVFTSHIGRFDVYHLKNWDASIYASIAEKGYEYSDTKSTNSGFFALFPYEWRMLRLLTGAGWAGICLLNLVLFISGMLLLKKAFDFSWSYFLLFLALPSNMFMLVPYSEATFFFFSALAIYGLKSGQRFAVITGLLLASLTRPAGLFFIPAIVAMEILSAQDFRKKLKNILLYGSLPLLGTFITILIQFQATGVWFAYFKTQSNFFNHHFNLPQFPLTTWGGPKMLWLDGAAFYFGLLALILLIVFIIRRLRPVNSIIPDKTIVFSLSCLFMALCSVLFYNGVDETGGTSLLSLNRYIFATPFFVVLLWFISHHFSNNKMYWTIFIVLALLTILLLKFDGPAYTFTYTDYDKQVYRLLVLLNILLFGFTARYFGNRFIYMIYIIQLAAQIILLHQFAHKVWVG